jgi:hypothetical protein
LVWAILDLLTKEMLLACARNTIAKMQARKGNIFCSSEDNKYSTRQRNFEGREKKDLGPAHVEPAKLQRIFEDH